VFIDIDYQKQDDGSYLIDDEKDGRWDAKYDPTTDELSFFDQESSMSVLILVLVFFILIALISLLYVRKKKKFF
jgi:LPXTG-motif cell wall-anchored protein